MESHDAGNNHVLIQQEVMEMEHNKTFPIQCATMNPLYNTPVQLFICDVVQLIPLPGTKSIFMYKSHPINVVDLFGIITSVKRQEGTILCTLDDGTGFIQCYCSLRTPFNSVFDSGCSSSSKTRDHLFSQLSGDLRQRLFQANVQPRIRLGEFLHVRGKLKKRVWDNSIYVSSYNWDIAEQPNTDDLWEARQLSCIKMYSDVYDKPFNLDSELQRVSKSFFVKELMLRLKQHLQPVIKNFINVPSLIPHVFFGFELLDTAEIQHVVNHCFDLKYNADLQCMQITNGDKKLMPAKALSSVLYTHVASGHLVKRKCLKHEVIFNMDEMDSRYFVTIRSKPILLAVQKAIASLEKSGHVVQPYDVLQAFSNAEFNFIHNSKHGIAIITVAMEHILHSPC